MADEQQLLVPIDQYLKAGIHIGTKFKTKYMENFIYKNRPDGLYVLNLQKIDERLETAAKFLARYEPEQILVVCRRENGWKPAKQFGKLTGAKVFAGRYPPGILTNPDLSNFMEVKVILAVDAWPDRNAINDAKRVGVPVIALCDTNNQANNIDLVIPCNNKGKKALGLLFHILTTEYLREKGLLARNKELDVSVEDFTEV
ncbi:TPA: 30S ribosomal protein S2 [Candidatus Woesearchaeota archaeon]|nr:30S ribosomal protein S2 [Candidatus Woesearchaeota archaeon]